MYSAKFPQVVQTVDIAKVGLELSLSSCDLQTCMHMTTIHVRDVLALAFDGRCSSLVQCPQATDDDRHMVSRLGRSVEVPVPDADVASQF